MESTQAVAVFAALAQETRLAVYRLLVEAGHGGMAAGRIGAELGLPSATLSFHLKELRSAGVVVSRRESRSVIYTASFDTMTALLAFLTDNCCRNEKGRSSGRGDSPASRRSPSGPPRRRTKRPLS